MAEKKVPLSIVLRTVDQATAGIQAFNKRLEAQLKPVRDFKKAFGELRANLDEKFGFSRVADGFKSVGGAVKDLIGKVAVVGGVAALAVRGLFGLVDEFDDIGDKSEKLGVTVDFLSSMRFAAEKSGASVDELDQGITAFGESMGQLRAGGGGMLKFLSTVSPALVTQLKATKGNEAAFRLLADAMAKVTDRQKRLALSAKTVGNSALAPLLARGSKGLAELQDEFIGLAGSQEDAAEGAGKVDDSLKELKAATTGVKAALVSGLAPALKDIVDRLKNWLVDHREDIRRWAEDIGKKLPGAVDRVVKAIKEAVTWVTDIVDRIGGLKVALGIVAVATSGVGQLTASIVQLGVALGATPFAPFLAGLAMIASELAKTYALMDTSHEIMLQDSQYKPGETDAEYEARRNKEDPGRAARMAALPDLGQYNTNNPVWDSAARSQSLGPWKGYERDLGPFAAGFSSAAGYNAYYPKPQEVNLKVEFSNAPRGLRASLDPKNTADVDLTVGHQLLGAGL